MSNKNNQNTSTTPEARQPFKIEVEEHPEFPANTESFYTSSQKLCDRIANLFGPVFADLAGVKIGVNGGQFGQHGYIGKTVPQGGLYVDLYFADRGEASPDKIKNLIPLAQAEKAAGRSMAEKYNASINPARRRMYELTQDTKDALEDFLIKTGRNLNWNEICFEIPQQISTMTTREEVVVQVTGLNLVSIMGRLYGTRMDEGIFQYDARWAQTNAYNTDFLVLVSRINMSTMTELSQAVGVTPNPGLQYYAYNG